MKNHKYIGHDSQVYGIEEHRLIGGKGDGMRLFQIRNGKGLDLTVSADRCADLSRVSFQGVNMGYFAPCGYVGPQYYDDKGAGFMKSFTGGFLTTCGLYAVGGPCLDDNEELPQHGTIGNCPAEHISTEVTDKEIIIKAKMVEGQVFGRKLVLNRTICVSLEKNEFSIQDKVENQNSERTPIMILYHMNLGYPLLSEDLELYISSKEIEPCSAEAAKGLDSWNKMIKPTPGFKEQCFNHSFEKEGIAAVYNPTIEKGLKIQFDTKILDSLTEWKMMGERDYVLGLEPGNCYTDGRDKLRQEGRLKYLEAGESMTYRVTVSFFEKESDWKEVKRCQ